MLDWYWGLNNYSMSARLGNGVDWLFQGIHAAGPKLTPETFKQGQFSMPAVGGSASGIPLGGMTGYGRTTGLPYDQYNRVASDFLLMWMRNVEAPDATGTAHTPSAWYVTDPKTGELQRYRAGTFPTKKVAWFDPAKSIVTFETIPPEWGHRDGGPHGV